MNTPLDRENYQMKIWPHLEKQIGGGDEWPTWRIFWAMIYHDLHPGAEISCLRDLYEAMKVE